MGVLSELLKLTNASNVDETIKALGAANKSNKKRYSSITRMSNEGTLQFPTLVSTSLDIETLQMVTKALERNYSSVVQTVISLNPTLDMSEDGGPIEYLKQFHQNTDIKGATSNPLDAVDNLATSPHAFESYTNIGNDSIEILAKTYEVSYPPLVADNKEQNIDLLEDVRGDVLNRKYAPARESIYKFSDPKLTAKYNSIINESRVTNDRLEHDKYAYDPAYEIPMNDPNYIQYRNGWLDTSGDLRDLKRKQDVPVNPNIEGAMVSDRDPAYDMPIGDPDYLEVRNKWLSSKPCECKDHIDEQSVQYEPEPSYTMPMNDPDYLNARDEWLDDDVVTEAPVDAEQSREVLKHQQSLAREPLFKDMLTDNDAKKANELVPTLLHVKLRLTNKGENVGLTDFVIGIKAIMHPIKSEEFVENIVEACRNNNKVFNFLRWTTGEISFFKDFVFSINQTKADIGRNKRGSSSWWLALKNRKSLASIKNTSTFAKNRMLPNCTLVMSIEEVNFIKSAYGFDLFKPIFIDKIMRELFLLGFVIVDNSSQVVHFLFDGQKRYQTVTFSSLERENNNDARKFKEMLKTINRL